MADLKFIAPLTGVVEGFERLDQMLEAFKAQV